MKQSRITVVAAVLAVVAVAATAAVTAPTSDGATLAPSAPALFTVTLHRTTVGAPSAAIRGRTTVVVRNARAGATSFVLARHSGGLNSLPRLEGMPFVPADEIVGRLHRIPTGKQRQLVVTLTTGSYMVVATQDATGAVFVDAQRSFRVS